MIGKNPNERLNLRIQRRTHRWIRKDPAQRVFAIAHKWNQAIIAGRKLQIEFGVVTILDGFDQAIEACKRFNEAFAGFIEAAKLLAGEDDPRCYCMACKWQGRESELTQYEEAQISVCPHCNADEIVFRD